MNLVEENVGDRLAVKREEILDERPHERASFPVQFRLAQVGQLGRREPRQSVADSQPDEETDVRERRPPPASVPAAAEVRHSAADVLDRAAVDRRTERGEEARRVGRDGGAGRHELADAGPLEAVDQPATTAGLARRRRRRRRRWWRGGVVVDGTVETSGERLRVRPRLSDERRRIQRRSSLDYHSMKQVQT